MAFGIFLGVLAFSLLSGLTFRFLFWRKEASVDLADVTMLGLLGFIPLSLLYCLLGLIGQLHRLPFLCGAVLLSLPGAIGLVAHLRQRGLPGIRVNWAWVCVVFVLPAIMLGVFVSTMPPLNWDEISYALTFPKLHIAAGNLHYLTQYGIFSAFPLFGETPIGIAYLLRNDPTGVHLVVLSFLCVSCLLTYRLYLTFGKSRVLAWLAVIGVAYLPLTLGNIGTAKIEPYQLAFILAAVYALCVYGEKREVGYRYLSYLFIGFAAGIKYTTIFAAPFYLCVYVMTLPREQSLVSHLRQLLALVFIGVAVNAVWLGTNWVNVCNPFFPNLVGVFGQCLKYPVTKDIMDMVMEGTMLQKGTSWATTHSLDGFQKMFVMGFGAVNAVLVAVSLVLFVLVRKLRSVSVLRWFFGGIVITLLIQAFAIYWEFRYTYFIFTFMLLFSLLLFEHLGRHWLLRTLLTVVIGAQTLLSFGAYFQHNAALRLVIQGDFKRADYPLTFIHLYWVGKWVNDNTPADAVVAFNWGVQPFYYLQREFFFMHDWNPEENLQLAQNPDQLLQAMKNRRVSYLVWRNQEDTGYIEPSKTMVFRKRMNGFLDALVQQGVLVQVHARDDVRIFKLNEKPA